MAALFDLPIDEILECVHIHPSIAEGRYQCGYGTPEHDALPCPDRNRHDNMMMTLPATIAMHRSLNKPCLVWRLAPLPCRLACALFLSLVLTTTQVQARPDTAKGSASERKVPSASSQKAAKPVKKTEATTPQVERSAIAAKLAQWTALSQPGATVGWRDLNAFMQQNPDWPGQPTMRRNAEAAMPADLDQSDVLAWFERFPPLTAAGFERRILAMIESNQTDKAIALVRQRYIEAPFDSGEEQEFRRRYNALLRPRDHVDRVDRLIWDEDTGAAMRLLKLLTPADQAAAELRIALLAQSPQAEAMLKRATASLLDDPGVRYERVRWLRRLKQDEAALALMMRTDADFTPRPAAWWTEQHILARRLMEQEQPQRAYDLVIRHATKGGLPFAQAEFLAGWLALRRLDQPQQATVHFQRLYDGVASPVSKSRGAYWLGRAYEAMGDEKSARTWHETATGYPGAFYALLAADRLGLGSQGARPASPSPDQAAIRRFEADERVQAARWLYKAEGPRGERLVAFLRKLMSDAERNPSGEDHEMVARLAASMQRPDLAITTARAAWQNGHVLSQSGFPLLTGKKQAGTAPESALIHAIIRQESNFNPEAVSPVGARGLMQLMPDTARALAGGTDKSKKAGRSISQRLTADPDYNVSLGRKFLADLVERFSGSYIMAVAAYNAGPGRVAAWTKDYGDPREADDAAIDWIESIPFYETRNYVQRVLENVHLYRARLGKPPLRMSDDLQRGRPS
jgi:soluble lytic murein transglycosylase